MKKIITLILGSILWISCNNREPKSTFSPEVLEQSVSTLDGKQMTFKDILDKSKGKQTVIEVWASWCPDCIKALPEVETFQKNHPEINFIFVSMDRSEEAWQNGVKKYMDSHHLQGSQILMSGGWGKNKGSAFTDFIELDWIPRYMLLDENGEIIVYYAKEITDHKITDALK